jgi:DNA repair protein RecO (recombination protein O)
MDIYQSQGIILRIVNYSETSIICDIYTEVKGLRSYIISGVRTSRKGGKAALFQPGNIVELTSYNVEADKLARIKDIHLFHHYKQLHLDITVSSLHMFFVEVSRNAIVERESNEALYELLVHWFKAADEKTMYMPLVPIDFMIELSHHLGFEPLTNFDEKSRPYFDLLEGSFSEIISSPYCLDEADSACLWQVLQREDKQEPLTITKSSRDRLVDQLIKYYQLHLPNFKAIKSLEILRTVLSA